MAAISQDPASGKYRIHFRYGGRQFQKSLKTTDLTEAEAARSRIELTLRELENGRMTLPKDADFWTFVFTDGERTQKAIAQTAATLDSLFDRYEQEMPPGSMEANSLETFRLHKKHLLRLLGRQEAQTTSLTDMQSYVNRRAKEKYREKTISPRTIKKEVATFRAVWNWGKQHGIVTGDAPIKGLRYEKEEQDLPFQTWDEIERRVGVGGLEEAEIVKLWTSLFLRKEQVVACLEHVRQAQASPFVYPMFVFVAHTGARRSEMVRSRVEDIDFERGKVTIRERKRDRTYKETRREVDMSSLLRAVMKDWLDRHPGGPNTFCHSEIVRRSKKRSKTTGHQSGRTRPTTAGEREASVHERESRPGPGPLTKNEASHHFKWVLAGSKWSVVRGFHVFRHSFASNLAAAGAREDYIDTCMGHQTEEMRRRYRHLFPEEGRDTINKVFG